MFVIRIWVRSSSHTVPLYLVEAEATEFPRHFDTRWTLPGNKIQTYAKEESAVRAFNQLVVAKPWLNFYQWDDSDALIEGASYQGRPMNVPSYEIQLMDLENGRIPKRLSGPR
jgi:hypothetical protein